MAEARAATLEPKVRFHDEGTSEIEQETKVAKSFFQDLKLCAVRTRMQIYNGLWPTTWDNLLAALMIVFLIMYIDHPKLNVISYYLWAFGNVIYLDESYPHFFRMFMISLISSVIYFIVILYTRQYFLRMLLSYKGWLYQPPRSQSKIVLLWGLLVRIVSGRHPRLYSYQNSLPRMSVPPLKNTVMKFLESVKPVLDSDDYVKMEKDAKEFLTTLGPKLQRILQLKSWWAPNYCTDWWEKYVYLMGRDPIAINSNYYVMDQGVWVPTSIQTARAAGVTSLILLFKKQLESEQLDPLLIRKTIPLCMHQYQRLFGSSRIPKKEQDKIRHHPGVEHIAVLCKGHFYKLFIVDAHGHDLSTLDIQAQFEWIVKDAEKQAVQSDAELRIAAVTGTNRNTWAQIRIDHFSSGINRDSMHAIEESLFLLVLDDHKFPDLSSRGKYLLHGDGASIWFDKSFNVIIFADGKMGMNCEHGWADAPVMGHLMEALLTNEYLYRVYDDRGYAKPFFAYQHSSKAFQRSKALITPMRLYWDINDDLVKCIDDAFSLAQKNNADLALCVRRHDVFGKGFIKTAKTSPDAFIQIALQLAYYKDANKKFALTYESSMTRLFLHGRTETVRSFTQELKDFILAMDDPSATDEEKFAKMKAAAAKHQDSSFLKSALTMPWTLSTSQQPQQQMDRGFNAALPEVKDTLSPGGGFGPVSDSGYGVSYMIPDDDVIFFHVSSKVSCKDTDSNRFMDNIYWAMSELKSMTERASKKKK